MIVLFEVAAQAATGGQAVTVIVEVNVLILHTPPQPLDEAVVDPAAPAVHAHFHAGGLDGVDEARTGELGPLIPGEPGRLKRVYGKAQTPLARVLASAEVSAKSKQLLKQQKTPLNPFALRKLVAQGLKEIAAVRQLRP
jgi:hypothetical protein